ncbi:MAG: YitT family protein [Candidatus Caenarcaniphilales bacterium]|nr:YitT family protein [Candidatus Caenarcaniphilales bacterium]
MPKSKTNLYILSKKLILICLGVFLAGLGIKGFLIPNHFIDGGVTGLSMLVSKISGINLSLLIVIFNAPFILFGLNKFSRTFATASAFTITILAIVLALVKYPIVTHDKLLASVFGGVFLGAGIGLSIRGSSVLDGTEILALVLSRKVGVTVGDVILVMNIFIFGVGALVLGLEPALYSVLTYFSASKTADFIIHGLEGFNGISIISSQSEQIRQAIINETERGVTVYKGKGGFSNDEKEILFCVVTRLEVPKIKSIVKEIDAGAFIVTTPLTEASGGMVKNKVKV